MGALPIVRIETSIMGVTGLDPPEEHRLLD
jgi:hypothetical protein